MRIPSMLALAACLALAGCGRETARELRGAEAEARAETPEFANPIVGAWELVHGEYGDGSGSTQLRNPSRPFQLKVFTPTHFAYAMKADDGSFSEASAGAYTLGDGTYTETHTYHSRPEYVDVVATWRYQVRGDTLVMEGPTEVLDASGAPFAEPVPRMREVRVRAR